MLSEQQTTIVAETLRSALATAASGTDGTGRGQSLGEAADLLSTRSAPAQPSHPALPEVGASTTRMYTVAEEDTAAAMGHPDESVAVLGSPRVGLWFEITASALLPEPSAQLTHVGVGILVHHLGPAWVGENVAILATADSMAGRNGTFRCVASVGSRLVAFGTHQRVLRESR